MLAKHLLLLVTCTLPSIWIAACSSDDAPTKATTDDDAGVPFSQSPTLSSDAGPQPEASQPAPRGSLRIAQLSADMPAVDLCVAPHGTTDFQGPLLAQMFAPDGGGAGAAYGQVSGYVAVPVGRLDVRLVAAGSTSCTVGDSDAAAEGGDAGVADAGDSGDAALDAGDAEAGDPTDASASDGSGAATVILAPDVTNLPPIVENGFATLLVAGLLAPGAGDHALSISLFPDDAVLVGGGASLRAVNAVTTADALDFGLGSVAGGWVPLLTGVSFGQPSTTAAPSSGTADPNGYMPIAPLDSQSMSARAGASPQDDTARTQSAHVPLGSVATVFAIGGTTGDGKHPHALLVCIDNATAGSALADCSVSP